MKVFAGDDSFAGQLIAGSNPWPSPAGSAILPWRGALEVSGAVSVLNRVGFPAGLTPQKKDHGAGSPLCISSRIDAPNNLGTRKERKQINEKPTHLIHKLIFKINLKSLPRG